MPAAVTRSQRPSCAATTATLPTSQHTASAHHHPGCHVVMRVIWLPPATALPLAPRCSALPPRRYTFHAKSLAVAHEGSPGPGSTCPRQDAGVEAVRLARGGAPPMMGEDHPDNIGGIEEVDSPERRGRPHALP